MSSEFGRREAVVVFEAPGDLDAAAMVAMRPRFEALATEECDVVIDMRRVEFIDSSGIGAIVFVMKRLAGKGRTISLRNASGQPLELLSFLRMDCIIGPRMATAKGKTPTAVETFALLAH